MARLVPYVLYETLGPTLPEGLAGAAALWGLAQKTALTYPDAVRRAGHADGDALFDAILNSPSGVTFTAHNYDDDFALIGHADHKIALEIPEMLDDLRALTAAPPRLTTPELPIVLSVGERRAYTANDIFRDPLWRKRDTDGRAARQRRRRPGPRACRRVSSPHHHGGRQRGGHRRDHRDDAARTCGPAQRFWARLHRRRREYRRSRCGAQRAHLNRVARQLRGHAVAQARARAHRTLASRASSVPDPDPLLRVQK